VIASIRDIQQVIRPPGHTFWAQQCPRSAPSMPKAWKKRPSGAKTWTR
jgi:hypothetical protein